MQTKKIRILVVDDQNVVRDGLVTMLSFHPEFQVVGEAQNGLQAVEVALKSKPDVVLLDLFMPIQDGLTTIPRLRDMLPNVRILVLTSFAHNDLVYRAIKAGALGYLLKDTTRLQLIQSIQDVAAGIASIQPSMAMKAIMDFGNTDPQNPIIETLTHREMETLRLIARGFGNQEIALLLNINERTIAKYVSNILKKLQVSNRTQAALCAVQNGLTPIAATI